MLRIFSSKVLDSHELRQERVLEAVASGEPWRSVLVPCLDAKALPAPQKYVKHGPKPSTDVSLGSRYGKCLGQ